MTPTTDYSTWFTKQAAAELIGVSTKTIENLAAQSKIASDLWRNPAGGPMMRVYAPDDVNRLAAARQDAGSPRFTQGPSGTNMIPLPAAPVGLVIPAPGASEPNLRNFLEIYERSQKELSTKIASTKLFLTIKEAAELSGLSQAYIHRACVDGRLGAVRDGQVWKIRRTALDGL